MVDACLASSPAVDKSQYGGYNLLIGDVAHQALQIDGNHAGQQPKALAAGLYGLSNGTLNEPWPKTSAVQSMLRQVLDMQLSDPAELATSPS